MSTERKKRLSVALDPNHVRNINVLKWANTHPVSGDKIVSTVLAFWGAGIVGFPDVWGFDEQAICVVSFIKSADPAKSKWVFKKRLYRTAEEAAKKGNGVVEVALTGEKSFVVAPSFPASGTFFVAASSPTGARMLVPDVVKVVRVLTPKVSHTITITAPEKARFALVNGKEVKWLLPAIASTVRVCGTTLVDNNTEAFNPDAKLYFNVPCMEEEWHKQVWAETSYLSLHLVWDDNTIGPEITRIHNGHIAQKVGKYSWYISGTSNGITDFSFKPIT